MGNSIRFSYLPVHRHINSNISAPFLLQFQKNWGLHVLYLLKRFFFCSALSTSAIHERIITKLVGGWPRKNRTMQNKMKNFKSTFSFLEITFFKILINTIHTNLSQISICQDIPKYWQGFVREYRSKNIQALKCFSI